MKLLFCYLSTACLLVLAQPRPDNLLVVDRAATDAAASGSIPVNRTKGGGFLGDHFRVGAEHEVWIIDTIRTWVRATTPLGDRFESVSLFGGIETPPAKPGDPPQPECDCHNLMAIKMAHFQNGDQLDTSDVAVTAGAGLRRVDFQNLHWSVPGGVDLQYGIKGTVRGSGPVWTVQASPTAEPHTLKAFDDKGKLEGPYTGENDKIGFNVQVWAHKSAPVSIRSASTFIEVALRSENAFDAAKTDPSTLRLGPRSAAAVNTRVETVNGHAALIARFRRADTGIPTGVVSVCLTGRQQDGVPFEGCDLISSK